MADYVIRNGLIVDGTGSASLIAGGADRFAKTLGGDTPETLARRLWPEGAMVLNDVIAMRGLDGARLPRRTAWPSGHWDWPVHLPYRHGLVCGDLAFLGGQVSLTPEAEVIAPGDMVAQTTHAMNYIGRVLGELGLG